MKKTKTILVLGQEIEFNVIVLEDGTEVLGTQVMEVDSEEPEESALLVEFEK
jgi:hypothetical protein